MHDHSPDRAVAALAGRQHGVVSLTQLRRLGLSDRQLHGRLAARRLQRLHRGVYAVGHPALTERGRELAAVLACGGGAVLSHRSAARLWGLVRRVPAIEVTCSRSRAPGKGIVVHRSPVGPEDCGVLEAVPVTTVVRTILDLAAVLTEPQLEDAVNEAELRRLFDLTALEERLRGAPGRRGRCRLGRVLDLWRPPQLTRSAAERRFLELCAEHGLPTPQSNTWAAGHEVDFLWPAARLAVEVDGAAVHRTRRAFELDRRRDRKLAAEGIHVVRVTWRDLDGESKPLARELAAILAKRAP